MKKLLVVLISFLILASSCSTTLIDRNYSFFQNLEHKDCFVFTSKNKTTGNKRISGLISYDGKVYGVVELNGISSGIIDAFLRQEKSLERINGTSVFYQSTESLLKIKCVDNGLIMFTNDDLELAYEVLFENRTKRISDEDARIMSSYPFALYTSDKNALSKTFGFSEINYDLIENVILISDNLESFDAYLKVTSTDKAISLASFFKAKEIEKIRLKGSKPDYSVLAGKIENSENTVLVKEIKINNDFLPEFVFELGVVNGI